MAQAVAGTPTLLGTRLLRRSVDSITKHYPPIHEPNLNYLYLFNHDAEKLALLLTDLPALEELTIGLHRDRSTPAVAQSMSQLPFTMCRLSVIVPCFDLQNYHFGSVWTHLTYVEIGLVLEPASVLQVLQLCHDLSSLTVHTALMRVQTLEPLTHPKIQFLQLRPSRSLSSTLTDLTSLSRLFNALSLPDLRVFGANRDHSDGLTWPHGGLKALFARSNCPLERLVLDGEVGMRDEQRAEYVALIPSLEVVP
ncbi:hypothetical protein DEU56DRAFT_928391 [Suillus clintonianus]|uniref:uncharacterized protein n=1 Tax=Suillus clintonianus TaxID=1904413 RepID=UPI001B85F69E|nr:uncharacterized protein DEU56DRAFT_928391 [Suillus clintonianus]KAG2120373.1 hypothetical protein DEU56DRAFT_928391 [Suillus clintonianus]